MKRITISEDDLLTVTAHLIASDKAAPNVAKEVGAIWYAKLAYELFNDVEDCKDGQSCLIKVNTNLKF